jgi:hypothetical protein
MAIAAPVPTLLAAVRRRLWQRRFAVAVRQASWISAAWMLLIAAAHLFVGRLALGVALGPLAALWATLLARAALLAPAEGACALWADRHLDGASAYSTWLEARGAAVDFTASQALQSLDNWTSARVPLSLALLTDRPDSAHMARPLLSLLMCSGLAALVLALPGAVLAPPRPAMSTADSVAGPDRPSAVERTAAAADLASEVASALRPQPSREMPGRRADRASPMGSAAAQPDEGSSALAAPAGAAAGKRFDSQSSPSATPADTTAAAGSAQMPGAGAGRDVGGSADKRADLGLSRVLREPQRVQRFEPGDRRSATARQSDFSQHGAYDEESATRGATAQDDNTDPPAAAPPPATGTTRLSPTEATYVQAWMKASTQRR